MDPALKKPYRAVIALVIVLAGSSLPFVMAEDVVQTKDVVRLPESWQMAEPANGDQGAYNLTMYERTADGWAAAGTESAWSFEHRRVWLPLDGWQLTTVIDETGPRQCGLNGVSFSAVAGDVYNASGRIGWRYQCDSGGAIEPQWDWGPDSASIDFDSLTMGTPAEPYTQFCPYLHGLQGNTIQLGDVGNALAEHPANQDCWMSDFADLEIQPIGVAKYGTSEALVLSASSAVGGFDVQFTLAAELAYPVRIEVFTASGESPPFYHWGAAGSSATRWVFDLAEFSKGGADPADPAPLTAWAMKPWGRSGPMADVSAVWPLSDALEWLEEDTSTGYNEFMVDRPDAVLQYAMYQIKEDEGSDQILRDWALGFSDGVATFGGTAAYRQSRITDQAGLEGSPEGPYGTPTVTWFDQNPLEGHTLHTPGKLPDVPAASALFDRFQAVRGEGATVWGFAPCHVPEAGCTGAMELWVGQSIYRTNATTEGGVLGIGAERDYEFAEAEYIVGFTPAGALSQIVMDSWQASSGVYAETAPQSEPQPRASLSPAEATVLEWTENQYATELAWVGIVSGLAYWLWPAAKTGVVGLFSRTAQPKLLEHPGRQRILDAIKDEPGVHLMDLARRSDMPVGTIRHHIGKLTSAGLIHTTKQGKYVCHYVADTRPQQEGRMRSAGAQRIMDALENGSYTPVQLAEVTDLAEGTVRYHLKRLLDARVIRQDGATFRQA